MNIIFITKELPYPPDNGHRNRTFHLLQGLAQNNKIWLFTFGNRVEANEKLKSLAQYSIDCAVIEPNEINVNKLVFRVFISLFSKVPFSITRRVSAKMRTAVKNFLGRERADIIVCDSIYQAANIPECAAKKILNEHNIESQIMKRYCQVTNNIFVKAFVYLEHFKMRKYEIQEWRKFDSVLAVSETDKQEISKRLGRANLSVISNGVDLNYFSSNGAITKPYALAYIGQMNWYPNIDAVMYFLGNIYPVIKKEFQQASFYIVGANPPKPIQKLARIHGAQITGYVSDTRPYIQQTEVFVVPLRIGGGTRLKILEAMAMGKAVVSTSIGCEGLKVTHEENILIADNPEEFATCVKKLFNNQALRENLGTSARRFVEQNYSWDLIVKKLNSLIQKEAVSA